MEANTKQCPYCAEIIHADAVKCKHCGELLDATLSATKNQPLYNTTTIIEQRPERKWSPGVAALLSFIIPGAGQMYKGHVVRGLFWFVLTIVAYCFFIIPGIVLHVICIVSAASGNPYQ